VVNAYGSLLAARHAQRTDAERVADSPVGHLDIVWRTGDGSVQAAGWAIDAHVTTPVRITVLVDGNPAVGAVASGSRPELAGPFPGRGVLHGFVANGITASPGSTVCVVAHSIEGGGNTRLGCARMP
jgi:hypothetical protein